MTPPSGHITPPKPELDAFTSPHCSIFAEQIDHLAWLYKVVDQTKINFEELRVRRCRNCSGSTIWFMDTLIFPSVLPIAPPNSDLNQDIQDDYREAQEVLAKSPRSSAALLRLCVQKLCQQLGCKGKEINEDIGELVQKGLPQKVQHALDIVRVVGNESVHPGQINLNDNQEIANTLFVLVNLIAEVMISQPKEIQDLYDTLPETKREAIEKRDNPASN